MPVLDINLRGDGAFEGWTERYGPMVHLGNDAVIQISGLEGGMGSGLPSVALGFALPDGRGWVLAETSLRLFLTAADALKARFGDPRT